MERLFERWEGNEYAGASAPLLAKITRGLNVVFQSGRLMGRGIHTDDGPVAPAGKKEVVELGQLGFVKRVAAVKHDVAAVCARKRTGGDQDRKMVASRILPAAQAERVAGPRQRQAGKGPGNPGVAAGIAEKNHVFGADVIVGQSRVVL